MPAGAATVAFSQEDGFNGSLVDGTTWHQLGTNITVTGPTFERNQTRDRQPDDPRPRGSHPGNARGSATVEFTLTGALDDQHWHDLVFVNSDGDLSLAQEGQVPPSAQVYFAGGLVDGSDSARLASGAVVIDAEIVWTRGEDVRISLTFAYADETTDPDPTNTDTPETDGASVTQPLVDGVYAFHGADIDVGGTLQAELSNLTLSMSNLARLRFGQQQIAVNASTAGAELSLSTDATFTETDQLTRALSGRSTGGALVDETTANIPLTNGNDDTIVYTAEGAQPNSQAWSDLVNPDSELSENVEYHVTDVSVGAPAT